MALTKECKQEMEHLLTLVERQKQYRTGVVFPSRMNNYFYDAGTGKILRLQDEEYRLLKAIFYPLLCRLSLKKRQTRLRLSFETRHR